MNDRVKGSGAPLLGRLETLTVVAVMGVLALAVGLAGLVTAGTKTVTNKVGYTQSGTFGYSATAPKSSVYGAEGLSTGEPIMTEIVGPVKASFGYQLTSDAATQVHGSAEMLAVVKTGNGFSRTFPIAAKKTFTGDKVTMTGALPLDAIGSYLDSASSSLATSTGATIELMPAIEVSGSVGGHALKTTYDPTLPFTLDGTTLTVSQGQGSADGAAATADVLKPSSSSDVKYRSSQPATVSLLVAHTSRSVALGVGFGLVGLCLLLGLWIGRPLLGGDDREAEPERIRALYGSHLVPVRALNVPEGPIAEVSSMSALAELAKRYESMIMHVPGEEADSYLVWDNGMLYRYTVGKPGANYAAETRGGVTLSSSSANERLVVLPFVMGDKPGLPGEVPFFPETTDSASRTTTGV